MMRECLAGPGVFSIPPLAAFAAMMPESSQWGRVRLVGRNLSRSSRLGVKAPAPMKVTADKSRTFAGQKNVYFSLLEVML